MTTSELPELIRPCDTCGGCGVIWSPAWKAWWERHDAAQATWKAANPGGGWHSSPEYKALDEDEPEGPEEPECPTCHGDGSVPTEAGKQILALVRLRGDGR